jgi:hypothetical protein
MFNFLSAAAVADGADYVYRINDDTEFATPWARMLVRALREFSPMNVGVVGPLCRQGNVKILTHDFVHRSLCVCVLLYVCVLLCVCVLGAWLHVCGDMSNSYMGV